jgi:L-2-hydroxyglutarate oxidase LhgO
MQVNTAGLYAPHVASRIKGLPVQSIPDAHFAKGNYFSLEGKSPFGMLVYPVPVKHTAGKYTAV